MAVPRAPSEPFHNCSETLRIQVCVCGASEPCSFIPRCGAPQSSVVNGTYNPACADSSLQQRICSAMVTYLLNHRWQRSLGRAVRCKGSSQMVLMMKNPPANAGEPRDTGSTPGWGRSPGEGNSNRLQYSCLKNPMDRGAWRATVHGVTKSWTRLSD